MRWKTDLRLLLCQFMSQWLPSNIAAILGSLKDVIFVGSAFAYAKRCLATCAHLFEGQPRLGMEMCIHPSIQSWKAEIRQHMWDVMSDTRIPSICMIRITYIVYIQECCNQCTLSVPIMYIAQVSQVFPTHQFDNALCGQGANLCCLGLELSKVFFVLPCKIWQCQSLKALKSGALHLVSTNLVTGSMEILSTTHPINKAMKSHLRYVENTKSLVNPLGSTSRIIKN